MSRARIVRMTEEHPDEAALKEAGEILKRGGLVAFPTETVYGLGGNALDPEASMKIYAAKGRPSDNPLIVHIADMEMLYPIVKEVPEAAVRLAERYWPGPLTMIFEKNEIVPMETTGGLSSVAVRFPSNKIAMRMIREAGGYVAAPSANTSGRPSPTLASHVIEDLGDKIDMIIDGGQVNIGLESTIVDFTESVPVILRPGFLNKEMLEEVLGEVRIDPGIMTENIHVRPKAPGMRYKHYAPKADLSIVEGEEDKVFAKIRELTREKIAEGKRVGIICTEESRAQYTEGDIRCIGTRSDDRTIAHHLFEILRDFDADGVDVIYSESFHTPRMGQAIMNRLIKSAGHTIIEA
ncbi:MAG: L-threonylcarbamoyladenylate synthase [Eubacterium sp.]|nr:L-threonylcarbamoyladenylate synthase [Eubacterium sp.]